MDLIVVGDPPVYPRTAEVLQKRRFARWLVEVELGLVQGGEGMACR